MNQKEYFPITSVSRDDLKTVYPKSDHEKIDNLSDEEMAWLARKMAEDYCNQLFWDSLKIISQELIG